MSHSSLSFWIYIDICCVWHPKNKFFLVSDLILYLSEKRKYQGGKEFHRLARIGCYCNIMVFSPFKVKVTYYHQLNQWLLEVTNGEGYTPKVQKVS